MCPSELRKQAMQDLAGHAWVAPEHRVVYEALAKIREQSTASHREQLPQQATRMGFPDVEWTNYFEGSEEPAGRLAELVRELLSASNERS